VDRSGSHPLTCRRTSYESIAASDLAQGCRVTHGGAQSEILGWARVLAEKPLIGLKSGHPSAEIRAGDTEWTFT